MFAHKLPGRSQTQSRSKEIALFIVDCQCQGVGMIVRFAGKTAAKASGNFYDTEKWCLDMFGHVDSWLNDAICQVRMNETHWHIVSSPSCFRVLQYGHCCQHATYIIWRILLCQKRQETWLTRGEQLTDILIPNSSWKSANIIDAYFPLEAVPTWKIQHTLNGITTFETDVRSRSVL